MMDDTAEVDGFDLLVGDLDTMPAVDDYDLHSEGDVLVRLKTGELYRLTAERVA